MFKECNYISLKPVSSVCLGELNREEQEIILSYDTNKRFRSLDAEFPSSPREAEMFSKEFRLRPYLESVKSPWDFLEKATFEVGKLLFTTLDNINKLRYAELDVNECFDEIVKHTFEKE